MERYFGLKENIVLISGASRGLIQDLNHERIFSIDKSSICYLNELLSGNSIEHVTVNMKEEVKHRFVDYLELLINKNLGFYSNIKVVSGKYTKAKRLQKNLTTVWFELRKACNLNCCHCYMDCNINSDKDLNLLSTSEWKLLVDELEELKPKKIVFIGGEPLLFKDIIELINYCKFKCSESELILYTNLTLLNDNLIKCIQENKVKIITSIYSDEPEIHDKITGQPGSFDKTIRNIIKLKSFNIYIQANTVITNYNYEKITNIKDFTYKLTGVRGKFDIVRDIGNSKEDIIPQKLYKKFNRVKTEAKFMPISKEVFSRNYSGNSCWQGKINITCDGYVGPCIMGEKFLNTNYNVRNHSLKQIMDNYIIPRFWMLSKDSIDDCKDCEYRYVCKDCRPMNVEGDNMYSKGKLCKYNPYLGEWENYSDFRGDRSYEVSPN